MWSHTTCNVMHTTCNVMHTTCNVMPHHLQCDATPPAMWCHTTCNVMQHHSLCDAHHLQCDAHHLQCDATPLAMWCTPPAMWCTPPAMWCNTTRYVMHTTCNVMPHHSLCDAMLNVMIHLTTLLGSSDSHFYFTPKLNSSILFYATLSSSIFGPNYSRNCRVFSSLFGVLSY